MFQRLVKKTRRLTMEQLSQRDLLAGDCAAAVTEGELKIECDDQDNELFVQGAGDSITVIGTSGTTINGATLPGTFSDVDELKIELGAGDDNLGVVFASFDEVKIEGDGGNDQVVLLGVSALEEAKVELGSGDDLLLVNASNFGSIEMEGGAGFDVLNYLTNFAEEIDDEDFEFGNLS